jgi:hypothetical protein
MDCPMESDRTTFYHRALRLFAGDLVGQNAASFAAEPEVTP